MPHTRSAKKNLRKAEKRRLHNRSVIKTVKTHVKRAVAAAEGTVEELQKEYDLAARKLDKAAAKRIIHPNLAARHNRHHHLTHNQHHPCDPCDPHQHHWRP